MKTTARAAGAEREATIVFPAQPNPHAFIRIGADHSVTVVCKHLEMGQGIHTGLATLVAEEMDAAWQQMRVEPAPADASRYGNLLIGGGMGTGGQTSMQSSYLLMRSAGAAARAMLVAAAAGRWGVEASALTVCAGVIRDAASGRQARFGEFASAFAEMPVPARVALKPARDFVFIGKPFSRLDIRDKHRGSAVFTQDFELPGMLTALVARPLRPGSRLRRFDAGAALAVPGVQHVVAVDSGVVVVANDFWTAKKGRDALVVEWDDTAAYRGSSAAIFERFRELATVPGAQAVDLGDVDAALAASSARLTLAYEVPFHAHATMETMNVVVQLSANGCEIWGAPQMQMIDQGYIAQALGLPPQQVKLNMLSTGGSFGRRAHPHAMPALEAVAIAKACDTEAPIKVMWTRQDDLQGAYAYYRPGYLHRIEACLDGNGAVSALAHRIVGPSILTGTVMEQAMVHDGVDHLCVEGAQDQPYAIANHRLDIQSPSLPIRASWLRSSGTFHNVFAIESAIDELALLAGVDPVRFRRAMLGDSPRERACLDLVALQAGWGDALAPGRAGERRGRGVALCVAHRSYAALVAEVTVRADGGFAVDRVVCALDCGLVVNPDNVRAQIEGSVGFGLTMAMQAAITFADGVAEQSSYRDYPPLRISQMPRVEAFFVDSQQGPSGCSETVVPLLAPALANAIFDATGQRLRQLPLRPAPDRT